MKDQDLKTIVRDYAALDSPSYAIMLNGPWGSGKTYFINSCFHEFAKKTIYVSLYGVSSPEQIKDKIFTSLTSMDGVSDEEVRKTSGFVGNLVSIFSEIDSGSAVGSVVSTVGSTIKSRILRSLSKDIILIFDDLERASLGKSQALSCVNEFVEHQGLNVVVLCDEARISEDEYWSYKEKLILYTYQLTRSAEDKVAIAIDSSSEVPEYIRADSRSELCRLLKILKCENLRTIKLSVSSYSKLIKSLSKINHEKASDSRLTRLLFPCLAYAIGYREMQISTADLGGFTESVINMAFRFSGEPSGSDKTSPNVEKFYREVVQAGGGVIEVKSAYKMVCLGWLDVDELSSDVSKWDPFQGDPKMNIIHSNYNFNDKDFCCMVESVVDDMRENSLEVASAQELLVLIGNLHYLAKKEAFPCSLIELENDIRSFVDYVIESRRYGSTETRLRRFEDESCFVKEMCSVVDEKVSEHISDANIASLQEALIAVVSGLDGDEVEDAKNLIYRNKITPFIFSDFVDPLIMAIKQAKPRQLDELYSLLRVRYSSSNIFDYLGNEGPSLKALKLGLDEHFLGLTPSLTKFHLGCLRDMICNVLTKREQISVTPQ